MAHASAFTDWLVYMCHSMNKILATPLLSHTKRYDEIVKHLLRLEDKVDPRFRSYVKKCHHQLLDHPSFGLIGTLDVIIFLTLVDVYCHLC